jgi:hypothetical protein
VNETHWNIIGGDELAEHLRADAIYVKSESGRTVITQAETIPEGAISTGRALLVQNAGSIVPHLLGFRVIDEVTRAVHAGEAGQVYGCFGSYRVPRGTDPDEVASDALLPLLAVVLEILAGDVTDVWARRASLLSEGDAWFVTLHLGAVIVTLEAMATTDAPPPDSAELLIEVTGSDQVLRAEPFRQAVTVAPYGAPAQAYGWWEPAGERLLQRILELDDRPVHSTATRLQAAWNAIQDSAQSGEPVSLS